MAFYDWNKDGKKDARDDFIEYNIYKKSTEDNGNTNYSGGGMSTFGALCATLLTFFIAAAIAGAFGLEGTALVVVFLILVIIIAGILVWIFG